MSRKRIIAAALLVLILIAAAIGLWWGLAGRPSVDGVATPLPTAPPFTPPPSLEQLAGLYPEIADLLTDPKLSSVYKEFLVAYQQGGLAAAEELARNRGLLNDQNELRLILVLDTDDPEPLVAQLQAAGVRVESYYGDLVAVAVPLDRIDEAAQLGDPGATLRPLTELEHVIEIRLPESAIPQARPVQGEGVQVMGADVWHSAGYTGRGVKVAILDGAFQGYEALLGDELPNRVVYKSFGRDDGRDRTNRQHGTACAEIVHEVAPDAELYLIAYDGEIGLGQAVDWLISQGVDVVSYSMSWLVGPRDGTSRQARLVDKANAAGVLWVGSAGNYALSHYAGPLIDADGDGLHEFSPGEEALGFFLEEPGDIYIALNWDDWPRSDQDLDLYLMDSAGNVLVSSFDAQSGSQRPAESIWYELDSGVYHIVVEAASVSRVVALDLYLSDGTLDRPVPEGSLGTPADAQRGLAVGATFWQDDSLERFSSRGPTADGRYKPDITAPDGVEGVSYHRFFGTSAAAPHAAGAAALVLSAFPGDSPDQVSDFLQSRSLDLGPPGPDNRYGAGRLDLGPPPGSTPTVPPPADTPVPVPSPTLAASPSPFTPSPLPPEPTQVLPTPVPTPSDGAEIPWGILILSIGVLGLVSSAAWLLLRHRPLPWAPRPSLLPKQARFCGQCGYSARPSAQFCGRCGSPLDMAPKRCPNCGQLSRSSQSRFCGRCGSKL